MGDVVAPRVSVIIDTYNSAHLVRRAIESSLEQTFPHSSLEILVVDDGSTDNTRAVVERYAPNVQYIGKANGGQASAVNRGLRHARGEIICFLDGDDYFYPDKVARVVDVFDQRPSVGLVYNKFDIVDAKGVVLESGCPQTIPEGDLEGATLLGYSAGCVTSAFSARRAVLTGIEIPEEPFRVSVDYFLGNVLPLLTGVGAVHDSLSAWVAHDANSLLANPAGPSPELNRRHRAAILEYARHRLDKRFITYLGRAGMGEAIAEPGGARQRISTALRESLAIAQARVSPGLKLRAQAKLVASLLPSRQYSALRKSSPAARSRRTSENVTSRDR